MGGAVFFPGSLARDQIMVGVMAVIATSFKRAYARTLAFSAPDPMEGHSWPMPLLEMPGHSQASLAQPLVVSLLLSPGSWCAQGFVCALQEFVSPVLWKFRYQISLGFQVIPWGFSVPLPDPQVWKPVVGPRTFTTDFPTTQEMTLHMDIARW